MDRGSIMAHYECNSCEATYYDIDIGMFGESACYYHVCPEFNAEGEPIQNPRNENIKNENGEIISEGQGRTEIE
tara:strand:+ start:1239 stop:1460 length:222 start_codon:yes stop_codon:yes gene_type:complete